MRCADASNLAGFAAERLGGLAADGEADSTDLKLAKIYGGTVCSPGALSAFIDYCRAEAVEILRAHWPAVPAIAEALDRRGTMTGAELDELIAEAEFQVSREAELARRRKMTEMTASAEIFQKRFNAQAGG
jgi:hypothetical protein